MGVYISPANSLTHPNHVIHLNALNNALASRDPDEIIFLCGDFNARIHARCSVIEQLGYESKSSLIECVGLVNVDYQTAQLSKRGNELTKFCSAHGLTPLNRLRQWNEKFSSKFTSTLYGGTLLIDYPLVKQHQVAVYEGFDISYACFFFEHHPLSSTLKAVSIPRGK